MSGRAVVLVALAAFACAPPMPGANAPGRLAPDTDAAARFTAMERRLTGAKSMHLEMTASTEGAVVSSFQGTIDLAAGNVLHLSVTGTFGGQPVAEKLDSDGAHVTGVVETATPATLDDTLLVYLSRLGLTHTFAVLGKGTLPEGTDGTIRDWLTVADFANAPDGALTYHALVQGTATDEILYLNGDLPARRMVTVHFPNGDMHVVETYTTLNVTP